MDDNNIWAWEYFRVGRRNELKRNMNINKKNKQ